MERRAGPGSGDIERMSVRSVFANRVFMPLLDRLRGRSVERTLRQLRASQWWSRERLVEFQAERLQRLVIHAYQSVPYYRELMARSGLRPDDIRHPQDLSRLPLLLRDDVRENYPGSLCAESVPRREGRTGGSSTGEPLFFGFDDRTMDIGRAAYYRGWEWAGCPVGTRTLVLWGGSTGATGLRRRARRLLRRLVLGVRRFDAFRIDDELLERCTRLLVQGKIQLLYGYVSAIVELCRFMDEREVHCRGLRAVMTTAEVLPLDVRTYIEECLGAAVFDAYACGEVNGLAYECNDHSGLHVAMERAIVEIVDEDGRPLPPGQAGRIAITDLHNHAMPFIRYVNGDEGVLSSGPCECGRELVRLTGILGRTCDILDGLNGKSVHSYFFASLFGRLGWAESHGLRRFQIVQKSERDLLVRMSVETRPSAADEESLRQAIRDYLGPMEIHLKYPPSMEIGGSGKFRWTVNRLRQPGQPASA